MKIRAGFNIAYQCPRPTQMLLVLDVHPSRRPDLLSEAIIRFDPPVEARGYNDSFGNACTRVTAPTGAIQISSEFLVHDSGRPDAVALDAVQHDIKDLLRRRARLPAFWQPLLRHATARRFRLGKLLKHATSGWARVQANLRLRRTATLRSIIRTPTRCAPLMEASPDRTGVPRLRPPSDYAVPLCATLSGALLHRLSSATYRCSAVPIRWISACLVPSLSGAATGILSMRATIPPRIEAGSGGDQPRCHLGPWRFRASFGQSLGLVR